MKIVEINRLFDSTLLKPDATDSEITRVCIDAREYGFAAVCVNSFYTELVSRLLAGSGVRTCVVIGFPLGATASAAKVCESEFALEKGAEELDMVMNIGALKSGEPEIVREDIRAVVEASHGKALVKVILECCLLRDTEKTEACGIAVDAGADFVKTSTGFSSGGATVKDVRILKESVGDSARVKASGGIRDLRTALDMIDAGAERLGTSSGVALAKEARRLEVGRNR